MRYGYFDDKNKEYVIERPDTPASWSNYLGSTRYGAIITNNAGGYSFFHSTAQGRLTRLRFNNIPQDQPGKYIYIHDKESRDYWSASWQPVAKPLDKFRSECRHGTAYTKITQEYDNIRTQTTYFVPLGKDYEIWLLKIENNDTRKRYLRFFTYVEFTCNWNVDDDINNLQYTQYISKSEIVGNAIHVGHNVNLPQMEDKFKEKDQQRYSFIALSGGKISGYDADREQFLGKYRTYANPKVVERGVANNYLNEGGNPCGVLQFDADIDSGGEKYFAVLMGVGRADKEGKEALTLFDNTEKILDALKKVKKFWHSKLGNITFNGLGNDVQSMLNMWNPYNCLITYSWSRAASLIYTGERDGLGYRDTVQDLLSVLPLIPEEAAKRLELMITGQVSSGGAMPVVKPFMHRPGNEKAPAEDEYRSDDTMWLFNTIPAYVKESGNIDFYKKELPFADKGKANVLGHMKRAIEFNLNRSGAHGLPSGLFADWNDALRLGNKGESVFVSFQLRYALNTYSGICAMLNLKDEREWAENHLNRLDDALEKFTWDGAWYIRAFDDKGNKIGSKENEEGQIFLNPQTWAVFSGHASGERAEKAMESVQRHLATDYGIMLLSPPYRKADHNVIKAVLFNDGMKENAAIFNHTLGWAVIAETMLGHNERAYEYYRAYLPAAYNDRADLREVEPYVYCQSTMSRFSKHYGKSRLPWLTGTASWAYVAATQYIFGMRADYDGLIIDPIIPSHWKEFSMKRVFRNKLFEIKVVNSASEKRVDEIFCNGKIIKGNKIPADVFEEVNRVEIKV
jgi:cellobiose phosphorylase